MTESFIDADDYTDISEEIETLSTREFIIPANLIGERLDAALAKILPEFSRSRLTCWIKDGGVLVDGKVAISKQKVLGGEKIHLTLGEIPEILAFNAEPIDFPIVYEDDHILVINKPAGLVVHPAAGNWSGTLLNGLLHYDPELAKVPRAGIVHRLDKDTSGLMVVAKTLTAQTDLVRQLQNHTVARVYRAIANGVVPFDGTIKANIGRDPHNRLRMGVVKFGGKPAVTHVRVIERFATHSYIECKLETGRTHQIRAHMKEAGHPLAGDPVYGNPRLKMEEEVASAVKKLNRQALHAYKLSFVHPVSGETRSWTAKIPDDFLHLLLTLRGETPEQIEQATWAALAAEEDEDWDEDEDDDYDGEIIYVRD